MAANLWSCECGHTPCVGLDCGVYLPGRAPRKQPVRKSTDELAAIRAKAWATRRRAMRDSDGSLAEDAQRLSPEGVPARAANSGIAQPTSETPHDS